MLKDFFKTSSQNNFSERSTVLYSLYLIISKNERVSYLKLQVVGMSDDSE